MKTALISMTKENMFTKGEEIRIIQGANVGREGWLDAANISRDPRKVNVIVDTDAGLKKTWAKKANVGPKRSIHKSYWEALLYCAPDVENKMNTLAVDLAECQLDDIEHATNYLTKKFEEAVGDLGEAQRRGAKVSIRLITHEPKKRAATQPATRGDPMEMQAFDA